MPINAKLAELGEDDLLELKADDGILQAYDLDRITLEMIDAVRRLRTTVYLGSDKQTRTVGKPATPPC